MLVPDTTTPVEDQINKMIATGPLPQPTPVPPSPATINSSNVAPVTPIPYVSPNPTPIYPVSTLDTTIPTPPPALTPTESTAQSLTDQLTNLNNSLLGKSAYQSEEDTANGVDTANASINDLTAKLTGLQNEASAIPIQLQTDSQGRGITAGGIASIQSAQLRNNATQALTVSTLLAAAKGNLATAQTLSDKAVASKYDPIQEQITAVTSNLQLVLNSPQYSAEEKQQAQDQLDIQNQKQAALDAAKSNTTDINTVAITAAQNSATFKPSTLYPSISTALTAISNATTPAQAESIAVQAGLVPAPSLNTSVQSVDGRQLLINTDTGKTIKDLGPTSDSGTAIADVDETSIDNDVTAILEGRNTAYNIRQTMGRSNQSAAYMQEIRDKIAAIDPNFDFVASDAGGKSVSSAYVQQSTAAINSVLPDIDKAVQLSNQVSRIGVKGVDAALQSAAAYFGDTKVSNFQTAQKLIADEIGTALGAGAVSDMKLQLGFDVTDPTVTPEVFASNMALVQKFVENRLAGLQSLRYASSTATSTPAGATTGAADPTFGTGSDALTAQFDNLFSQYGGQ